jgi:hypothetical protein
VHGERGGEGAYGEAGKARESFAGQGPSPLGPKWSSIILQEACQSRFDARLQSALGFVVRFLTRENACCYDIELNG